MTKHSVRIAHLKLNGNQDVKLKYYVLEEKIFNEYLGKEYISFGIEIEKEENEIKETSRILDITSDKEKIYSMLYTMAENTLFPVHLKDVISDMI